MVPSKPLSSNGNGNGNSKPSFFKPIISTPSMELSIPKSFGKYLMRRERCKGEAMLHSENGIRKQWRVKMERLKFKDGWKDFAQEHGLCVGDLLVFVYEGVLVFHVTVFDPSGCEKNYSGISPAGNREATSMFNHDKQIVIKETEPLMLNSTHFVTTVQHSNLKQNYMSIPSSFTRSNVISKNIDMAILRDQRGRSWPVKLIHRTKSSQISMESGWSKFSDGNGLEEGENWVFELCSTSGGEGSTIEFNVFYQSMK